LPASFCEVLSLWEADRGVDASSVAAIALGVVMIVNVHLNDSVRALFCREIECAAYPNEKSVGAVECVLNWEGLCRWVSQKTAPTLSNNRYHGRNRTARQQTMDIDHVLAIRGLSLRK
jgi:hypothetical protein